MRRPLIQPDGTPFFQAVTSDEVLFDASTLDSGSQWAITLYAWFYSPTSPANIAVGINTPASDGSPVIVPTGIWATTNGNIDDFRENGIGPVKAMDRIVITGDQQVVIRSLGAYGAAGVYWWGHIERVGRTPAPEEYRQLQPSDDLSLAPFPPKIISLPAGGGTVTKTVHLLDNSQARYFDELSLWVSCLADAAPAGPPSCQVNVPGGVNIEIPVITGGIAGPAGNPIHLYDRIPVRAPAIDDNVVSLTLTAADDVATTAVCYGRFQRSA